MGAVATVGFLAAGCSAVTPAQNGSGASGAASSSGSADADTFGTAAAAELAREGHAVTLIVPTFELSLHTAVLESDFRALWKE